MAQKINALFSIREQAEIGNKIYLAFLREIFDHHIISTFGWILGFYNSLDGMTKNNLTH